VKPQNELLPSGVKDIVFWPIGRRDDYMVHCSVGPPWWVYGHNLDPLAPAFPHPE
jgi:hypothetical protein